MIPDLVYPVRSGPADSYEELRFSLRSAQAMLPDLGEVWLLGSAPRWVSGHNHLRMVQNGTKYQNVRRLLAQACASELVSDPFVWMNDDVFFWQPQGWPLRMLHGGPLKAYLDRMGRNDSYVQGGRRTLEFMRQRWGFTQPLHWGMHTPIVVHKEFMREALAETGDSSTAWHMRTIYGTLSELGGDPHRDVKIMTGSAPGADWPYVSTSDISFRSRAVGVAIRKRFPDPSRFESK